MMDDEGFGGLMAYQIYVLENVSKRLYPVLWHQLRDDVRREYKEKAKSLLDTWQRIESTPNESLLDCMAIMRHIVEPYEEVAVVVVPSIKKVFNNALDAIDYIENGSEG